MSNCRAALVLLVACSAAAGCSKKNDEPAAKPLTIEVAQPNPAEPGTAAPSPGAAAAAQERTSVGGVAWSGQSPLVARAPKSSMRAAEYTVEGDPQAELVVFYFGEGAGGGVEPNVTRWLGQFTQPDGSDTAKHAKRTQRTAAGMEVALVEASGTYSGGMAMPGAPAPAPQADAMLLGAIASGPKGPVFFKLVGKRASVESARAAFDSLVASLHPSP